MSGYLAEYFGEPETYISALSLKYDHQKQFHPKCIVINDDMCTEIINFFSKILQYPKDLSIIHSACAGIQYISITELDYSQTLTGLDHSKWQKKLIPFTEYTINALIDLMGHKWMIDNIYKSCLFTTYHLLKLAIQVNDKSSILKILKFSNTYKGKLNEFHAELLKELLLWATSVNVGFSSDYEELVLNCINTLYSLNLDHYNQISYIFTVSWIHKLSCKGFSFFKILSTDAMIDITYDDELYVTNELAYKIINRLNIFKLFIIYGPKVYFDSAKVPNSPSYQNLPTDAILKLAINAIKIAKIYINKELEPVKSTQEQITDDNVFITKAKMNLVPFITISTDLCVKLYKSSIDLIIAFMKSHNKHHINVSGNIYKMFIQEAFNCNNVLECQKFLLFFGETLSHFLSFLLKNIQPLWIPIKYIESIFDMFVVNQLELLVKTSCKDREIIFTIGKHSLEMACIIAKFVSNDVISNIITNIPSTIIRAQEAIIRIYLNSIKMENDGWQMDFINSNIDTILSFLSFSISGYITTPKNVGNNIIGLFKSYHPSVHNNDFKNLVLAHESQTNLTDEESKLMITTYQEVWTKMIELYTSESVGLDEDQIEDEKIVNESNIQHQLDSQRAESNIHGYKLDKNDEFTIAHQNDIDHSIKENDMQNNIDTTNTNISTKVNQNLLVDRMKRRLGEINKMTFK